MVNNYFLLQHLETSVVYGTQHVKRCFFDYNDLSQFILKFYSQTTFVDTMNVCF